MGSSDNIDRRSVLGASVLASGIFALAGSSWSEPVSAVPPAKPFYTATVPLPYRPLKVRSSDGVTIAAQEWGNPKGPEIIFIHGVLQSHLSFERQYKSELAAKYRLITYDLRGHGDSDKPFGKEHYLDGGLWADDLAAVIEGFELRRPVLVGWSLGGLPIGNYLVKFGDAKIAGLNFVDALTKRAKEFAGAPENRSFLPATASDDLATRIDAMRGFLRACFKTQPSQSDFERMLAFNAQVPQHVLSYILLGIPLNAEEAYRKVKVPVLITHGEQDGQINVSIVQFDQQVMPHAGISLYSESGHTPFSEDPTRFNSELDAFVSRANR
jgi:non-heme chloroperoxidase